MIQDQGNQLKKILVDKQLVEKKNLELKEEKLNKMFKEFEDLKQRESASQLIIKTLCEGYNLKNSGEAAVLFIEGGTTNNVITNVVLETERQNTTPKRNQDIPMEFEVTPKSGSNRNITPF